MISHPIPPVWDANSRILILGSFPSVKSRENGFFYGHPQNRFWRVLANIYRQPLPCSIAEKKAFLLRNRVALWDVISSCSITGSSDSSIRDVVPTDLVEILSNAKIQHIYTNGRKADALYRRYQYQETGHSAICLPSTSPANASWSLERLTDAWSRILE